jgi:drug/metabolite transporter (DMT)-like permease
MDWVIYALAGVILWAATNLVDKHFLSSKKIHPYTILVLIGFFGMFTLPFMFLFTNIVFDITLIFTTLIIMIPRTISLLFYAKSVEKGEVSRALGTMNIGPIIVAILAYLFLAESLTFMNYAGIILVVLGGMLLAVKSLKDLSLHNTSKSAFAASAFYAIVVILIKHLTGQYDYWSVFFWMGVWLVVLTSLFLFRKQTRDGLRKFFSLKKRYFVIYGVNEFLGAVGSFFNVVAISLGSASLVSAVTSTQPLFVLIFAGISTVIFPRLVKEDIGKKNLLNKMVGIVLVIAGTLLVI